MAIVPSGLPGSEEKSLLLMKKPSFKEWLKP